jgi:hypothetical protein
MYLQKQRGLLCNKITKTNAMKIGKRESQSKAIKGISTL